MLESIPPTALLDVSLAVVADPHWVDPYGGADLGGALLLVLYSKYTDQSLAIHKEVIGFIRCITYSESLDHVCAGTAFNIDRNSADIQHRDMSTIIMTMVLAMPDKPTCNTLAGDAPF